MPDDPRLVILADTTPVIRTSEVAEMINKPGASLHGVAAELGITHTRLYRALKQAGYQCSERWTHGPN